MTIWSAAVSSAEKHGTRKETRDINGGPGAEVVLQCAYADKNTLAADLMENSVWPFTAPGKYSPPVQNISITPLYEKCDTTQESIDYKTAELHVNYGFDNTAGSGSGGGSGTGRQRYTESFEPELEVTSLAEREYFWNTDDAVPLRVPYGKKNVPYFRQYTFSILRTYYNWILVPLSFRDLLGYTNELQVTFPTLGLTFEPEQLLFVPENAQRTISSEGTAGFTVSVRFKYKKEGWNVFPVESGEYEKLYWSDGVNSTQEIPHPLGDFSGWIY